MVKKRTFIGPLNNPALKPKIKAKTIKKKQINRLKSILGVKKLALTGIRKGGTRVRGRGAYSFSNLMSDIQRPFSDNTPSKGIINRGARSLGNFIGNELGIPGAGTALGNAGSWLSRAFGFGDYMVKKNTFMDEGSNIAQFTTHGTIEFAHREFVMDISSSTNFTNQSFPINPGNSTLFPWLSTLAKNFEQYEFLGLIFEYKTTSATAVGSTNTGLGTVIMATDYDVLDSSYGDKRAMEVAEFSTSAAPCYNQIHPIECDPRQNVMGQMFIQAGNLVSAYPDDPRFSALGNFQIATSGQQSVNTVGELWVSYHVRLLKPQLEGGLTQSNISMSIWGNMTANAVANTIGGYSITSPGAITPTVGVGPALTLTATTAAAIGTYLCTYSIVADSASTDPTWIGGSLLTAGGGTLFPNVANSTTGVQFGAPLNYNSISVNKAGSILSQDCNPATFSTVFTFTKAGDTLVIPQPLSAAATNHWSVQIAPYQFSSLHATQGLSSLVHIEKQIEMLRIENRKLLDKYSKNEVKDISSSSSSITVLEPDNVVEATINVLKSEIVDNYTREECEDRLENIHTLLDCELPEVQTNYLMQKLVKISKRLVELSSLQ